MGLKGLQMNYILVLNVIKKTKNLIKFVKSTVTSYSLRDNGDVNYLTHLFYLHG